MMRNPRSWADDGLDDPLAWIARALHRFAQDPGCQACIRLAREGLAHVLASLGASGEGSAAARLCAEILASAADLEEGRREWNAEFVMVLARGVEEIQARVGEPAGDRAVAPSGEEPLGLHAASPVVPLPPGAEDLPGSVAGDFGPASSGLRRLPVAVIDVPEPAWASLPPLPQEDEPVQPRAPVEPAGGPPPAMAPTVFGPVDVPRRALRIIEFDPGLLDTVIEDAVTPPSGRVLERLSRTIDGIGIARERWPATLEGRPVPAGLRARLDVLSRDAAETGAPRLAEFARALAAFLRERDGDADGLATDDVRILDDGLDVLPALLAEVHSGLGPSTPVLDILLRAQSAGSGSEPAEDHPFADPVPEEAQLDRIRRQGKQELARLAAAFAAIEDGPAGAQGGEVSPADAGAPALEVGTPVAEDLARIAADQQRIMAGLGLAGAELQALERLGSTLAAVAGGGGVDGACIGIAKELERARRVLGSVLGEISDAVLQQRRMLAELRDRVDPPDVDG